MKGARLLFGVSLVLLVLVAALLLFGSLASTSVALSGQPDQVGNVTFDQLRSMGADDAVKAIRGRRLTAATWAVGYGIIFAWLVVVPYRRGERWAWWALLVSLIIPQIISIARVVFIRTTVGTQVPAMLLAFGLLALLAGVPRLFFHRIDGL